MKINGLQEAIKLLAEVAQTLESGAAAPTNFAANDKTVADAKAFSAKIQKWFKLKICPLNNRFSFDADGYLLYGGKRPKTAAVDLKNYASVYESCREQLEGLAGKLLETPCFPEGEKVILAFLVAYDTIAEIVSAIPQKLQAAMEKEAREAATAARSLEERKKEAENRKEELKKYFLSLMETEKKETSLTFGNGYSDKVLLGYSVAEIPQTACANAKKLLGLDISKLGGKTPVWFPLDAKNNTIVVECDKDGMQNRKYEEFIKHLILEFTVAVPIKKLRIAGTEFTVGANAVKKPTVSSAFSEYAQLMFDEDSKQTLFDSEFLPVPDEKNKADAFFPTLIKESNNRFKKYGKSGNFFEFNKRTPDNMDEYILVIVNNYPYSAGEQYAMLDTLVSNSGIGIITVIMQDRDANAYKAQNSYTAPFVRFEKKDCLYITDVDDGDFSFSTGGTRVTFKDEYLERCSKSWREQFFKKIRQSSSLSFDKLMEAVKRRKEKSGTDGDPYAIDKPALNIPLGLDRDGIFDFSVSSREAPSALVLGGTGSGKTALLHTLVLSGASVYAPDEVEFYLADFKAGSTAFASFRKGLPMYIPHVRYLSLESNPANAAEMFDMISLKHRERTRQFKLARCDDIVSYNTSEYVKNNPDARMSRLVFIIDEFNKMLESENDPDGRLAEMLISDLTQFRTAGIHIVLAGQSDEGLNVKAINQISTRLFLRRFTAGKSSTIASEGEDYGEKNEQIRSFLSSQGKLAGTLNNGVSYSFVSTAYIGKIESAAMENLCESVRKKYKKEFSQNLGGSEERVDISSDEHLEGLMEQDTPASYSVFLGQSSTSSYPVALRYTNEAGGSNAFACAPLKGLINIEQNVMLGFLYATARKGEHYTTPRIFNCWFSSGRTDNAGDCLAEYEAKHAFLKEHIQFISDKREIGKKILSLGESNLLRDLEAPVLLLVHGVEELTHPEWWLSTEERRAKLKGNSPSAPQREVKIQFSAETEEQIQIYMSIGMSREEAEKQCGALSGIDTSAPVEVFSAEDETDFGAVKDTLVNLVKEGYKNNIFVLITSPAYNALTDFMPMDLPEMFVSDKRSPSSQSGERYPTSCCHVKSDMETVKGDGIELKEISSKVKLYDYSAAPAGWWENFKNTLN